MAKTYGETALAAAQAAPPAPTVLAPELRKYYVFPRFFRPDIQPIPAMRVFGFTVDPAGQAIDFTNVPNFDLSRLQSIVNQSRNVAVFCRPFLPYTAYVEINGDNYAVPQSDIPQTVEVDGVAVSALQMPPAGKVLKVSASLTGMLPTDSYYGLYDLPVGYVPLDPFDPSWTEGA